MAVKRFRTRSKLTRLLPRRKREGWSKSGRMLLMGRVDSLRNVRRVFVPTLLGLAMSLAGCATTSMPSSEPARIPSPPPTTLSERSETFSSLAQRNISEWRKKLTGLLPKP